MKYWLLFIGLIFLFVGIGEFPDGQFWVDGFLYGLYFVLPVWLIVRVMAWWKRRYT